MKKKKEIRNTMLKIIIHNIRKFLFWTLLGFTFITASPILLPMLFLNWIITYGEERYKF